jgi:hypothetical protein
MANSSTKTQLGKILHDNPLETAARDTLADIRGQLKNEVAGGFGKDFFEQLMGVGEKKSSGDLTPGEEINLSKVRNSPDAVDHRKNLPKKEKSAEKHNSAPGIDYRSEILHAGERLSNAENRELQQQIQELMAELQRLVSSSSILQNKFTDITTQQAPVTPGKYHLHFFQWMTTVIRDARMKVEDSGAWLQTVSSKKKMRQYGSMAKKHGTSFTLSSERSTATQTG